MSPIPAISRAVRCQFAPRVRCSWTQGKNTCSMNRSGWMARASCCSSRMDCRRLAHSMGEKVLRSLSRNSAFRSSPRSARDPEAECDAVTVGCRRRSQYAAHRGAGHLRSFARGLGGLQRRRNEQLLSVFVSFTPGCPAPSRLSGGLGPPFHRPLCGWRFHRALRGRLRTGVSFFFAARTVLLAALGAAQLAALPAERAGEFRAFFAAGRLCAGAGGMSAFLSSCSAASRALRSVAKAASAACRARSISALANSAATSRSSCRRAAANTSSRANSAWPSLVRRS